MSFDLQFQQRPPLVPAEEKPPCLVLLHGYGSNEFDLLGLGDSLDPRLHIVSIRGPISLGPQAYAWFDLAWGETGLRPNEEQAVSSRAVLIDFLKLVPERFNVADKFVLGGFSQGAMMSMGVALEEPSLVSAVIMMSGRALPAFVPRERDDRLKGIRTLVQHGTQDPVLPAQGSREAADLLRSFGAEVLHREYLMAHQVSAESLNDIKAFLSSGSPSHFGS